MRWNMILKYAQNPLEYLFIDDLLVLFTTGVKY